MTGTDTRAGETIPSLDGIRAIAVALVFFAHGGFEHFIPGGLGVTIFFVLSGFLISTLLRVEHRRYGAISYRGFYLRRLLRLMPPLFIVVALAAVLSAAAVIDGAFTPAGLLAALFYFGNYHVIATDFGGMPQGLGVIWSLAVEEHYYLFFPPLALLLLRAQRPRLTLGVLGGLCAGVLAWRGWLHLQGVSDAYISMATDTRIDAILAGCLMGLLWNPVLDARAEPRPRPWRDWLIVAACGAALLGSLLLRDEGFRATLRYTVQSAAIAPLIWLAVARAREWPFRWLNTRPLVYIGTISYTIYLSHHLMLLLVAKHLPEIGWLPTTLLGGALTLAIAEPMRRWIELPCARLRKRLHETPPARAKAAQLPLASGAR